MKLRLTSILAIAIVIASASAAPASDDDATPIQTPRTELEVKQIESKPGFTTIPPQVEGKLGEDSMLEREDGSMTAELAPSPAIISSFQPIDPMPGETLIIKGENFGLPIPGKRVVTIYFAPPVTATAVYMDLDVLSWKDDEIVARVPGVDEKSFRTAPYAASVKILPSNVDDLGKKILSGNLMIAMLPEQINSNELAVRLRPVSDNPEIYVIDTTIPPGGELVIYGSGLGEKGESSETFFATGMPYVAPHSTANRFEIVHWGNSVIKLIAPAEMKSGSYTIWVRDSAGKASNRIEIKVRPPVEVPAAGTKMKSRKVRMPPPDKIIRMGE